MEQTVSTSSAAQFETPQIVILPFEKNGEFYVEQMDSVKRKPIYMFIKRLFDIVVSLCAILVFALPMLIIALCVKLGSPGTALYKQERLGLNGKPFQIVKFRTMVMDAEANGAQWSDGESDSRITGVGAFLRKCRLDELPQFFNVLAGSMSLIGPRPERPCFYDEFETYIHGFSQRLKMKPGITGLAQVNGGYDLRPEEKIIYDVEYIKTCSLWLDIKILLKTVGVVVFNKGAK